MKIDLLLISENSVEINWPLGDCLQSSPTVRDVHKHLNDISKKPDVDAVLTWDPEIGTPDHAKILKILEKPGDVWHAGLLLGMAGKPWIINYIQPVWPFNCDPDPSIECTSWRISLGACLFTRRLLSEMGHLNHNFKSLDMAALEMGHRYLDMGVFIRHIPDLLPKSGEKRILYVDEFDLADTACFVKCRYDKFWIFWTAFRFMSADIKRSIQLLKNYADIRLAHSAHDKVVYKSNILNDYVGDNPAISKVSILIPTLGRNSFLNVLLSQIRLSTVKPHEVIVVDQNPAETRDSGLAERYKDLNIIHIFQDEPGQCSSRNEGLQKSSGDYILFLDDDDEIEPELISKHLQSMRDYRSPICAGHCRETGAEEKPFNFTYIRASDIFSTNNSMIKKGILRKTGMFDLAYNRGSRADGDLFMRMHLAGFNVVLRPDISVLHHHAPSGGLRSHKARKVTFASSRKNILDRQLPEVTELYLAMRYFKSEQVKEMVWLRVFGTFQLHGPIHKKILKILVSLVLLPHTLLTVKKRIKLAKKMLEKYPQIPALG